jgi:hypothetical protein
MLAFELMYRLAETAAHGLNTIDEDVGASRSCRSCRCHAVLLPTDEVLAKRNLVQLEIPIPRFQDVFGNQ